MLIKFLDGTQREIADLCRANLCRANLCGATLHGANLRGANLHGATLHGATLHGANLYGANLYGANLYGANLRGANLCRANLSGANLSGTDLYGADLSGTDLSGANLYGAELRSANLYGANLRGANLRGANLRGANLSNVKGLEQQSILPAGQLIGYKKLADGSIATLRIPAKAKRVNAYGSRKCRAEYVTVISGKGTDQHSGTIKYAPSKRIVPDGFDPDLRVECSHGIHFFITEQEAKDYS